MTTATTRQNIRRELYNRIPGLGFSGTADTVAPGSITDAFALRDSNLASAQYRGMYIYRPDRTDDDRIKVAGLLTNSTGLLAHTGSNYADITDLNYEIVGLLHPDELNACIQRAMQRIYYDVQLPLCGLLENYDGDMETSGVTNWTSVLTPATKEKSTTAAKIYDGTQALHVLNNAALEGVQSASVRVIPQLGGQWLYASVVVHADVGTAKLVVYNVTGSAEIESVTSAEEGFVHLWVHCQVPTDCEQVALQLLGVEDNADLYWSHAVLYIREQTMLDAPSWLDEQFKFLKLREASYTKSWSNQTQGGYDDAMSRVFKDWYQPAMFSLDPLHIDANPYRVQLMRMTPQNEMWIQAKRPYSDVEALGTESATTRAPLRLVYAYAVDEVSKVLRKRYPNEKAWEMLQAEAMAEVDAEARARPELPTQPLKIEHQGRV